MNFAGLYVRRRIGLYVGLGGLFGEYVKLGTENFQPDSGCIFVYPCELHRALCTAFQK